MSARGEEAYVAEAPQVIMFSSPWPHPPHPLRGYVTERAQDSWFGDSQAHHCVSEVAVLSLCLHTLV